MKTESYSFRHLFRLFETIKQTEKIREETYNVVSQNIEKLGEHLYY